MSYEVTEGEHAGHEVVKDYFGIIFCGYDKDTSFYCIDCDVSLIATEEEPAARPAQELTKKEG